jgi:flagellar biosynthesis anti-sigma factor FlgM
MIDGVGRSGTGRVGFDRGSIERSAAAGKAGEGRSRAPGGVLAGLFAELAAASGPPVDVGKIAAIRTAIAEGRYSPDVNKIAARMILLDLPPREAE